MKLVKSEGAIVLRSTPGLSGYIMLSFLMGIVYMTIRELLSPTPDMDSIIGGLIGFFMLSLSALLTFKKSVFRFELYTGMLRWRRRGLLDSASGMVPFSSIRNIVVGASAISGAGTEARLIIITDSGYIPVTKFYSIDIRWSMEAASEILRKTGIADASPADIAEASIEYAVASGRELSAVRLAIEERGMELNEAKEYIRSIKGAIKKRETDDLTYMPQTPQAAEVFQHGDEEVEMLLTKGGFLNRYRAVMLYRKIHGVGPREAKLAVDEMARKLAKEV